MANGQIDRARRFAALHVKGDPLILYNIWDAGSATAVARAGASAIATGSWSVAAAQGYPDGEALPLDLLERIVGRIAATVTLPVTVDIEGAYAVDPDAAAQNVARVMAAGAVGINVEDGIIGGIRPGLYSVEVQCARLRAIRRVAEAHGVPLFINARTDLFLQAGREDHEARLEAALERATAYAEAGASGLFVPGLTDESLIARVCAAVTLPVNVMMLDGMPSSARLAQLGVSRVSHGPAPYRAAVAWLTAQAAPACQAFAPPAM